MYQAMIAHRNARSRILRRREKRICKSALCTSQSGRSNSHTGTCRWLNEPLSCPGNSETKTARRRFNTLRFGWASRIRTYITGTKNQGPAIGRWPSVYALWAFWHYSVFSSVKPRAHVNRRQNQRTRNSQNATALAAATLSESTPWAMGIFTV